MRTFIRGLTTLLMWLIRMKPKVPLQVKHRRIAQCYQCPLHFYEKGFCNACGCNLELKTAIPTEACPRGLWTKYERKKRDSAETEDGRNATQTSMQAQTADSP